MSENTTMEVELGLSIEEMESLEKLEAQLAECRERVRVERQGYDLATEAAVENARQFNKCREELVECQARWRLAQKLDLEERSSDLGRLLEERWETPALDALLEQARAACAQIAEDWDWRASGDNTNADIAKAIRAE